MFWFENTSSGGTISFREHRIEISSGVDREPRVTGFNFDFADLNGDGRLDVVLRDGRNGVVWLEQPEDPVAAWTRHVIGDIPPDVLVGFALADIDDDGDSDLVAGAYSQGDRAQNAEIGPEAAGGRLAWFENPGDGTGTWTRHDFSRRGRGMFDKFIPRDMDGDGDIDFIGTCGNSVPYDSSARVATVCRTTASSGSNRSGLRSRSPRSSRREPSRASSGRCLALDHEGVRSVRAVSRERGHRVHLRRAGRGERRLHDVARAVRADHVRPVPARAGRGVHGGGLWPADR